MTFVLEKKTAAFAEAAAKGTPIYKLTPQQAFETLEAIQKATRVESPDVVVEGFMIPSKFGTVSLRIIRPQGVAGPLPAVIYMHGAGWVMGSAATHDHLVRELATQAQVAIIFVNYPLSPDTQFPVAIEHGYAAAEYIAREGGKHKIDTRRIAIAGDSVGGNMTIAVTLLAKERGGPQFVCQLLFYPVTDAQMMTASYQEFAQGPWLTKAAMEWFWHSYAPDVAARKNILMSPLQATHEQLKDLPRALVITDENDVLRDEGEAYAHKLMQAGVEVTAMRFLGTMHDFMMLNALAETPATKEAIFVASSYLKKAFKHL